MGFQWSLFGASLVDIRNLVDVLGMEKLMLDSLSITASFIDDIQCQQLSDGIKQCKTLRALGRWMNEVFIDSRFITQSNWK